MCERDLTPAGKSKQREVLLLFNKLKKINFEILNVWFILKKN